MALPRWMGVKKILLHGMILFVKQGGYRVLLR